MMRVGMALMVAALFAGEAQAADQFDLVCKGQLQTDVLSKKTKTYEESYRVDLPAGWWCTGDCTAVHRLHEVTPTQIVFEYENDPLKHASKIHYVNRTDGAWTNYSSDTSGPYYPSLFSVVGSCEMAPFSGINPTTKF